MSAEEINKKLQSIDTPETDPKFFDIDVDGLISLKPEYRGNPTQTYADGYPFSISDNGVGKSGSKNIELPERIVIPHNINGEQVKGFQKGTFCYNLRIKEVVLPTTIKEINNGVFYHAEYLEKVENTEQIEMIGTGGFAYTRLRELRFPNLKSLGNNPFRNSPCLELIDIGNITTIPSTAFYHCPNLTIVLGGSKVKMIEKQAFWCSRRLSTLPFIANVTSIGAWAFGNSNCNLEEVNENCTFGNNATYKQFNDTDYWSGATFTPCKNPLNSLFHQKNPKWADKTIGDLVNESGNPLNYGGSGCALITLAEIYSAFEGVEFDSPEEFVEILDEKNLLNLDFRYRENWCQIANALGYQTEYISTMTTENLQKVYDALADGALVYKSVMTDTSVDGGHATLCYGINSNGEMLLSDTSMHLNDVGIYENHKSALHIYKHGSKECDAVIVKKVNV